MGLALSGEPLKEKLRVHEERSKEWKGFDMNGGVCCQL